MSYFIVFKKGQIFIF